MLNTHKRMVVLVLVVMLAGLVVPAYAQQEARTLTLTEQQINESYRVTHSPRRSVTDVYVDLQPDQVVISAVITLPQGEPMGTATTLLPSLENGRVFWEVLTVMVDGEEASEALVTQINAAIASSWRNYFRRQAGTGRVLDIALTDEALTLTYQDRAQTGNPPGGEGRPPVPPGGEVTLTEQQINESYRVTHSPRRSVTDVHVDLQPGQAAIDATITLRGHEPVATTTTLVPSIENGRLFWAAVSVVADGEPASDELVAQVNAAITSSWITYFKRQAGPGRIQEMTISEDAITFTLGSQP